MIGDQQVRNRGTIGGSLAHADPSADYPAVMLALDAEFQLAGPKGRRVVKAQDFFQDLLTVDLRRRRDSSSSVQFAPVRSRPPTPSCISARRTTRLSVWRLCST